VADEHLHIEPVEAPLSGRDHRRRRGRRKHRPTRRVLAFSGALVVLAGTLVFVAVYLPDRVDAPRAPPTDMAPGNGSNTTARTASPEIVAPFEAAEMAQAREQAKSRLARFVALQLELEQELNVAAWGAADLDEIKDRATAADSLFEEQRFPEALDEYAQATLDLETLVARGKRRFDDALARGEAALDRLDHADAVAAFETASTIRPDDPRVAAGAARAARLPDIVELLRESDRAMLRGDHDRAQDFLRQVKDIDPAVPGLADRSAAVATARANEQHQETLSTGFSALQRGDYDAAIDAFERVLQQHPDDADAHAGRQQARQAKIVAEIDRLRVVARGHEQEAEWEAALAAYQQALAVDPTLKFAIEGKRRIAHRVALLHAMTRFIDDPGLMSADAEFDAARALVEQAASEVEAGEKFESTVAALRRVVEQSAKPVPLVLVSDNATEVVIQKVGTLGAFSRNELQLRPGRYIIVGSRDGCRDVRKEIILADGMEPVDIRCVERI